MLGKKTIYVYYKEVYGKDTTERRNSYRGMGSHRRLWRTVWYCVVAFEPRDCPFYCQAIDVAGGIATVLVAVAAIFVGLWWRLARPAFVAIAAALMLWGLASWLTGLFWVEAVVWSALVGALVYLLFSWLNRTQSIALTIILTALIVIAERIVLAL
jgi:hypothetical protein